MNDHNEVNGAHYQTGAYQHWDLVADFSLNYYEANATKYLTRWEKPTGQGIKDLKKAHTYIMKFLGLLLTGEYLKGFNDAYGTTYKDPRQVSGKWLRQNHCKEGSYFRRFVEQNRIYGDTRTVLHNIIFWHDTDHLKVILSEIEALIESAASNPAAHGYVKQEPPQ